LKVFVVDVGQGLCVLASAPDGHNPRRHLLYDGGGEHGSEVCLKSVTSLLERNRTDAIDTVVISHFDYDHILNLEKTFDRFQIGLIVHTGADRSGATVETLTERIEEMAANGVSVISAASSQSLAGTRIPLGDAWMTILSGWSDPSELPDLSNSSERHNGVSIAVRVEYGVQSVLLAGDSVGRPDDQDVCGGGEAFMVRNSDRVPLRSDVLVASHHGADDGSAACFIETVSPEYVVFSAGDNRSYQHPRKTTVDRFQEIGGVPFDKMFQTDFGTGEKEDRDAGKSWMREDAPDSDVVGDDHIEIRLCGSPDCSVEVEFTEVAQ
jgi:beta-lactamase superfamily II metal-dependent hydrolase